MKIPQYTQGHPRISKLGLININGQADDVDVEQGDDETNMVKRAVHFYPTARTARAAGLPRARPAVLPAPVASLKRLPADERLGHGASGR